MRSRFRSAVLKVAPLLVALLGSAVYAYFSVNHDLTRNRILTHGSRAWGTVLAKRSVAVETMDRPAYSVKYMFTLTDGHSVTNTQDIPFDSWKALAVGSPLEIAMDPSDPSRNYPVAAERAYFLNAIVFGALIFVGLFILLTAFRTGWRSGSAAD